jgi:hypothetical protein
MAIVEDIVVRIRAVSEGFDRIMARANDTTNRIRENFTGFNKVMGQTNEDFRQMQIQNVAFGNAGARTANRLRLMTHGMRGFRMEMLGVMFFGMAMANMFSNMLKPAAQVFGIFELWTSTLQVVFLPIMQLVAPLLINLMLFFMGLPGPAKIAIGALAIFGLLLGKILFIVGTLALGLGSLFQTSLPALLAGAIKSIAGFVSAAFSIIGAFVAIAVVIVIGMVVAWRENFGNFREWFRLMWIGIVNIFSGVINIIKGIFMVLVGFFTLNFGMIFDGWKLMWAGIKDIVVGAVRFIVGLVTSLGLGVWRVIKGLWDKMKQFWNWVKSKANKLPGVNLGVNTGDIKGFDDVIWRPGQAPIAISPQDTVMAFKGAAPGGGISVEQNITVTGSLRDELVEIVNEANSRLVGDIKRLSGA